MARFEITDIECAPLGKAPAAADTFYELGMMYSVGRSVPVDFVAAHKWFNLAAMRGNRDAGRLRRELADQMLRKRSRRRSVPRGPGSRQADRIGWLYPAGSG
jgi:TPR repeat protein